VILGVRVPDDLAVDRGRDLHEPAVAGSVRRTRRHGGERRRDDAGGERREGVRAGRRPTQDEGRHPRDHAVARVEGVGDRLDAVRGHAEPEGPAVGSRLTRARQHRLEQRGPDAAALVRRQHEQHREEPDVAALPRGREPHDPSVALRDEEEVRVRRAEVRQQRDERHRLPRRRGLPEGRHVVTDGDPVDLRAGREVLPGREPDAGAARAGRRAVHSAAASSATDAPVASRSSSACMKVSRSPSSTPVVSLVSCAVRWSFTIW